MKFQKTEPARPEPPRTSPVPNLLCLAAGLLLSWLPLLFTRGTQSAFSNAPTVWIYTLGAVLALTSLGVMTGHIVARQLPTAVSRWLQTILLFGAFASLPLLPPPGQIALAPANAALELLKLLLVKAGPTAFALGHFLGARRAQDPEDNTGMVTLIGLLAGPILFLMVLDPLLPTTQLDVAFSWTMLGFALAAIGWQWFNQPRLSEQSSPTTRPVRPRWVAFLETALLGVIAALLLVITARSMSDAVSAPALWVLPLLITLVAYSAGRLRPALQRPVVIAGLQIVSAVALTAALIYGPLWSLAVLMQVLYFGLATGVMACAASLGRLADFFPKATPRPGSLVGIVLACGLVTYVAQQLATDTTEYQLTVLVAALLVVFGLVKTLPGKRPLWVGGLGFVALVAVLGFNFHARNLNAIGRVRTFYGVTTAVGAGAGADAYLLMRNGDTPRAAQFLAADARFEPILQHARNTGIGLLFRSLPKGNFRRVGIVGIGNGGLVAYAHPTDIFRFYEYDPGQVLMAQSQFGYLPAANFDWDVIPGDPRRVLEKEEPGGLDLLILDVFSSGALPAHLLTAEAFATWQRQLAPDGVLAINTTNRRFDLLPVVWRHALELDLKMLPAFTREDPASGTAAVEWVFLTNNSDLLRRGIFPAPGEKESAEARQFPLWTDERYTPMAVLK